MVVCKSSPLRSVFSTEWAVKLFLPGRMTGAVNHRTKSISQMEFLFFLYRAVFVSNFTVNDSFTFLISSNTCVNLHVSDLGGSELMHKSVCKNLAS